MWKELIKHHFDWMQKDDYKLLVADIDSLLKEQVEIIAEKYGVDCPYCNNVGWYPIVVNEQRAIQISDNPDEYEIEVYQEQEQCQCKFCCTQPNSKFNILNASEPTGETKEK